METEMEVRSLDPQDENPEQTWKVNFSGLNFRDGFSKKHIWQVSSQTRRVCLRTVFASQYRRSTMSSTAVASIDLESLLKPIPDPPSLAPAECPLCWAVRRECVATIIETVVSDIFGKYVFNRVSC